MNDLNRPAPINQPNANKKNAHSLELTEDETITTAEASLMEGITSLSDDDLDIVSGGYGSFYRTSL